MEENIVAGAVIVAIVNGIQLGFESFKFLPNIRGFISFVISVVLGLGFGYFGTFGLTLETGLITALAASGLYKVAQVMGGSR